MPVIGFLHPASPDSYADRARAFVQGLSETGYVESHNVAVEYRSAGGQNDRLPGLAADLVRHQVKVIAAMGGPSALAAKAATSTTPIVFNIGLDPVKSGLVTSLNRPGGNVTGVSYFSQELGAKRFSLLHLLVPNAVVIGMLVNPTFPDAEIEVKNVETAARSLGHQLLVLNASSNQEIDPAFARLVSLLIVSARDVFGAQEALAPIESPTAASHVTLTCTFIPSSSSGLPA